jgi:phosphopantetheinyl transferase (holo-ACP synthase)
MSAERDPDLRQLAGVGCDTEERSRLEATLGRDPGFLERWFLPEERALLAQSPDPTQVALQIFCLKEASIKALGSEHALSLRSVCCLPDGRGGWMLSLAGRRGFSLEGLAGVENGLGWARVLAWRGLEKDVGEGPDARRQDEERCTDLSWLRPRPPEGNRQVPPCA